MDADLKEAWASLNWSAKAVDLARTAGEGTAEAERHLRDAKEHAESALVEINRSLSKPAPRDP